jgi:hypothetical protein
MATSLTEILDLVGTLDDSAGTATARDRFRSYLKTKLTSVAELREYIQTCLLKSGDQYNRALQDLVNRLGELLEFKVEYGRYRGVVGEIGHDGLWLSPSGLHIVVEVKTTDAYSIKTATLLNYVDRLISEKRVSDSEHALGLYVVARPDSELKQLENAIVAEKRLDQLRVITAEALLTLAELALDYEIDHESVLTLIKPSGPRLDETIKLMARMVAIEKQSESDVGPAIVEPPVKPESKAPIKIEDVHGSSSAVEAPAQHFLVPVGEDGSESPTDVIKRVVGANVFAFGEHTPNKKNLKAGDWLCFYASGIGVAAHARVKSAPQKKKHPAIHHPEEYPWVVDLEAVKLYTDNPIVIDGDLRQQLDAFKGKKPEASWGWFVVTVIRLRTIHDFNILTGAIGTGTPTASGS